jgi:hypothetical protein
VSLQLQFLDTKVVKLRYYFGALYQFQEDLDAMFTLMFAPSASKRGKVWHREDTQS